MKLSPSEHKIKESLEQREIMPSKNLWDNIQQELDKEAEPRKKYIWYRVASVAAILCLAFLAYQGLTKSDSPVEKVVIENDSNTKAPENNEVKPIHNNQLVMEPVQDQSGLEDNAIANQNVDEKSKPKPANPKPENKSTYVAITTTEETSIQSGADRSTTPSEEQIATSTLDAEIDALLAEAALSLEEKSRQKSLEDEVNNLLNNAIAQTDDEEQKQLLNTLSADLLLAEAEHQIDLQKPPKFKDKVWDALVANFNDIKQDFAFN